MRRRSWNIRLAWFAAAALTAVAVQSRTHAESDLAQTTSASRARVPSVPLFFVLNQGQSDAAVRFQTRALGGAAFFTATEVVLALPGAGGAAGSQGTPLRGDPRTAGLGAERGVPVKFVRVRFVGASSALRVEGAIRLPALVHEFRQTGAGSSQHANLPTFANVVYRDLYEGVDLHTPKIMAASRQPTRSHPESTRRSFAGATRAQLFLASMRRAVFGSVCRNPPPQPTQANSRS